MIRGLPPQSSVMGEIILSDVRREWTAQSGQPTAPQSENIETIESIETVKKQQHDGQEAGQIVPPPPPSHGRHP